MHFLDGGDPVAEMKPLPPSKNQLLAVASNRPVEEPRVIGSYREYAIAIDGEAGDSLT